VRICLLITAKSGNTSVLHRDTSFTTVVWPKKPFAITAKNKMTSPFSSHGNKILWVRLTTALESCVIAPTVIQSDNELGRHKGFPGTNLSRTHTPYVNAPSTSIVNKL
jgi:hypothetical protein